jgi:hypothetical protein
VKVQPFMFLFLRVCGSAVSQFGLVTPQQNQGDAGSGKASSPK